MRRLLLLLPIALLMLIALIPPASVIAVHTNTALPNAGTPEQVLAAPGLYSNVLADNATSKGGDFFSQFPIYVWIIFGVIFVILLLLFALLLMKPKKKPGMLPDQSLKQGKQSGKAGKPGSQETFRGPGGKPMTGMPGGMPPGMQGPGQFGAPFDNQMQGMTGMQQPFTSPQPGMQQFPQQGQPGMQQQFPPQGQPGMQQQFPPPPGMQAPFQQQQQAQPGMGQQFPPTPGTPAHFQQQGQPAMHPGFPPAPGQGMQPPSVRGPQFPPSPHIAQGMPPSQQPHIPGAPQPGMPMGMQPPAPHMPHPQQPQAAGMQGMPPGQPPMQPGMHPTPMGGMQQPIQAGYQSMGMPKFSVSNLSITPNSVKVGEPVNVSIYVTNNGVQTGKYSVVLRVGGVVENISDMTLAPGGNQTASFVVVKDAPGDYYADIDGLGGFFNVIPLAPPSFIVSNFSISPERVRQGQPVIVTASVTNTGEIMGSHPLIIRVKGMAEAQQDVMLAPGKTQDVEFQIVKDTPGFYPVSMENWTGKFVVEMDWTG